MSLLDDAVLPHRVDVLREVYTPDDEGGKGQRFWEVRLRAQPAWVQAMSAAEIMLYQARGFQLNVKVYFASNLRALVDERDLIRHVDAKNGETLLVAVKATSDRGVYVNRGPWACYCEQKSSDFPPIVEA